MTCSEVIEILQEGLELKIAEAVVNADDEKLADLVVVKYILGRLDYQSIEMVLDSIERE